jgi:hypothetical protein
MNPPAPGFVDFFAGSGMEFEKRLGIRGFEIGKSVPVYGGVIFTGRDRSSGRSVRMRREWRAMRGFSTDPSAPSFAGNSVPALPRIDSGK